jgi:hypothetical protein
MEKQEVNYERIRAVAESYVIKVAKATIPNEAPMTRAWVSLYYSAYTSASTRL